MVQTYLFFNGRCEEALHFYQAALGAEILGLMRFGESPDRDHSQGVPAEKIRHAEFRVGETKLMASDGRGVGPLAFEGFALSISVAGKEEGERPFSALAEGGAVVMPLMETFFSPYFGMATDRFGITWMIMVPQPPVAADQG